MGSQHFVRVLLAACIALSISACGGGGSDQAGFVTGGGVGGGGTDGAEAGPRMGVLNNGVFQDGVIEIGATPPLAAGGTSGLRVNIVDTANGNALVTDTVTVTFASACASGGDSSLAVISPASVETFTGTAVSNYRAQGCSGDDLVRATATVGGVAIEARGVVTVTAGQLGSVQFVSATPTTIGLRGSGQNETSTVVFRVTNNTGGPVSGQSVNFSLNTTVGGLNVSPAVGQTDGNGMVAATVTSGSVLTSVRVTAQAERDGVIVSSQSEQLSVSTAIPDQDSISLSVETLNPEALGIDGVTDVVTARMADRFNNPVPDGTAITFTTEGARIDSSCLTVAGACSVNWISQNPRPSNGRSTVLAFAVGEESFSDADGDGLFDTNEFFSDLPEAFLDRNENGQRDLGPPAEEFFDFDGDQSFDPPDGQFNGLLCDAGGGTPVLCPGQRTVHVRDDLVIVMSGSAPVYDAGDVTVTPASAFDGQRTITVASGGSANISLVVRDVNDQPMPSGTTIAFTLFGPGTLVGTSSFTVPNTTVASVAGNRRSVTFRGPTLTATAPPAPPTPNGQTVLEVVVTSPGGLRTTISFDIITTAPVSLAP